MGKRTRAVSEDYESIANKIRKLEQKLMRTRRRHRTSRSSRRLSTSSSSDTSRSSSRSSSISCSRSSRSRGRAAGTSRPSPTPPDTLCIEGVPKMSTSATVDSASAAASTAATNAAATASATPLPSTSAAAVTELFLSSADFPPGISAPAISAGIDLPPNTTDPAPALNDELLLILGDDPSQTKSYGELIQPDLAVRLQHIARTGLPKDVRKELTDKYLPPSNCTLIEAPTLNPEVVAAVSEAVLKRDKGIEARQKQRTSTISGVATALTLLMSSEPKNTTLIQILMDAIKLLCDSQNCDSIIRRGFILNVLKKDLKDQLQATKVDKLLFSEGLAEALRAGKAITKSGADMKSAPAKPLHLKNKQPQKQLNWRAPPQNHRPKGTQRTKEPVYKDRPANSSKLSSRPAQYRSRNRR